MKKQPERKMTAENKARAIHLLFSLYALLLSVDARCFPADTTAVDKKRLRTVVVASGVGYGASVFGLQQLWYRHAEHQPFSFFNDLPEWKQVDKAGHFYSAYYLSLGTSHTLAWCNVRAERSDMIGALTGFAILLPIEIFDGYSAAYGASATDLLANAAGASFFLSQQLLWREQRLIPKFSFQRTPYAALRPDVLGDNSLSQVFKDYNGQTYWLSADIDRFTPFPKWLNIAIGIGGTGMVFGRDAENQLAGYTPQRQFYLSLDPDLTGIRTRSKFLRAVIRIGSMIKIPSPTLEWSSGKAAFHIVYF